MDGAAGFDIAARRAWMGLLAGAPAGRLVALLDGPGLDGAGRPDHDWLRAPEIGTAMMQGRAGATGAPFNLGEVTVTRCALRLPCGTVGHGWVQGRDRAACEAAGLVDALMQTSAAPRLRAAVLDPLTAEAAGRAGHRAARAAATRVDFLSLVRGEDR